MSFKTIDAKTVKTWVDNNEAVLVDVREPAEHKAEKIEGAKLVPLAQVSRSNMPDLKGKKLVIHCAKGGRGSSACHKLASEMPDVEIYNLEGGITAWSACGLPVRASGKKILPLDRQVQLTIGIMVFSGSLLSYLVSPAFFIIPLFMGAGLTIAGITGFCGLARLMALMPWNKN